MSRWDAPAVERLKHGSEPAFGHGRLGRSASTAQAAQTVEALDCLQARPARVARETEIGHQSDWIQDVFSEYGELHDQLAVLQQQMLVSEAIAHQRDAASEIRNSKRTPVCIGIELQGSGRNDRRAEGWLPEDPGRLG